MFCASESTKNNQEEGELAPISQEEVAPQTNNEGRNYMKSQYECTTLFSCKEACGGGHVKDDEQHDGCNPFIIHEKKPKVQHLEFKGQLHTFTIFNQK
jgi:hypothetical protein